MAFKRKSSPVSVPTIIVGGSDVGVGSSAFTSTVIINSGVMQIGDLVSGTAGTAAGVQVVRRLSGVDVAIIGVCVGFGQASGAVVAFDAGTNDTVTVGAANETVAKIYAIIDITPGAVWSAPVIAGTTTTTLRTGWNVMYNPGTTTNCGKIDETSAVIDSATLSLSGLGTDPDAPTTNLLVVFTKTCLNGVHA